VGCLAYHFPFEGIRIYAVSRLPSPEISMPLLELVAFQSLMNADIMDVFGLSIPTRNSLFPTARWYSTGAVPRSLARPGSSSRRLCLSFRVLSCLSPARHLAVSSTFHGVSLPFATLICEVHSPTSFPLSPTFRPQCFSHSRRLTPSHTLWAYFIPLPRPGFALQGLSPLPSRLASSTSRALMVFTRFSSQQVTPLVPDPLRINFRALIRATIRYNQEEV
jgi:hypothetical protein